MRGKTPPGRLSFLGAAVIILALHSPCGAARRPPFSFSASTAHLFPADLDGGGTMSASRLMLSLGGKWPLNQALIVGAGLSYDVENYNFDGPSSLWDAAPWDTVHRTSFSLALTLRTRSRWICSFSPSLELAVEKGADWDRGLSFGGTLSAMKLIRPGLLLGIGAGVFDRVDKRVVFPYLVVDWQISERFRISNPFRAGPAGPAGLEAVYRGGSGWEAAIGGAYRSFRFRLDNDGAVPGGIGENRFIPLFLRLTGFCSPKWQIDLYGGTFLEGKLKVENSSADAVDEDQYKPSLFFALTLS
ncbi:hypothetical protein ACFL2P_01800, partial [Candidatus Moduliflexota bacterium]